MNLNPNCDGCHCRTSAGEVRLLPTGGDGNAILCRACFDYEIRYRREAIERWNTAVYELPQWSSLKVYEGTR